MADKVYKEEEVVLQDGTEVTLRPLPIGPLRRFLKAWAKFADAKDEDEGFDVYINCSGIALEKDFEEVFDTTKPSEADKKKGEVVSPEYKEHLENILELDTIFRILDTCGGIQLRLDPKALEEVQTALETVPEA